MAGQGRLLGAPPMVQPLQERNRNKVEAPSRKVWFEASPQPSPHGGDQSLCQKFEEGLQRLQQDFNRQVSGLQQDLASKVNQLQEEIQQAAALETRRVDATTSNEGVNREALTEPEESAPVDASPKPYEQTDWALMVAEMGAAYSTPLCESPGRLERSPTTPSSSGESAAVSDTSSPQVEWTVSSPVASSPVSSGHRVRATLPALGLDRRLPQAPPHEPPRGPTRALSANLPEECFGSGLARTSSRPLLTVDGPRSARQSRPSLAVPQGAATARVRVETRESRGTIGCLASPRRLTRIQPAQSYPVPAFSRTVWPVRAPVGRANLAPTAWTAQR